MKGSFAVLAAALLLMPVSAPTAAAEPAVTLDGAHWIWYPEGDPATSAPAATRYLRRAFTVAASDIATAQLVVTGDDTIDVWVNGVRLAGSPRAADSWKRAVRVDLAGSLHPGSNTVALAARNTGGPAGVLGRLHAGSVDLVTDGSWRAATGVPENWADPAFSDVAWTTAKDLGAYGGGPWGAGVALPDPAAASPVSVTDLTVNRQADPVGVDTPRFGWRLAAGTGGQMQGRYQLTVGSTAGAADVWDSGIVASTASRDIGYSGPALGANRTYFWRVRVWDAQGRPSAWSAGARFDTGIALTAAFVGAPPAGDLSGADWIWYPEGDPATSAPAATRYFRRTVTLATSTTLVVAGDDTADVWVDGTQISASPRVTDSWKTAATVTVPAGTRTIAIAASNTTVGPAGVIAKLGGIVTDGSWRSATAAPGGWQQPGFDDSGWLAAKVLAAYGSGPWGGQVLVPAAAPYLRKGFAVTRPVARARLFATALGLHDTYLNGARVGTERLAPGWTDYTKRVQYRGYDVTAALRLGDNALAAQIGHGWYSGNIGFAGSRRYGTQPWYAAQLIIEYTDGTSATVQTDGSWRTAPGNILGDDLYAGETQDARLIRSGWNTAGFDDSDWVPVTVQNGARPTLVPQVDPGVTVQQELRPVAVTQPKPGVFIADLGQNFTGWDRLRVSGPAGTTVTLRHGEILNADGTLYTANLRAAQATDRFTLAGTGTETFEPRFTVHGYRYVEITGFPGTPDADSLTGLAAWTGGAATGMFTSSDSTLNQVQRAILWGARSNLLSIPTDCPQRDERLGWTGDIAAFVATSTFNFDTYGLLAKFATDLTDAQHSDGAFTDVAPDVLGGAGKAGWGDAGVIVPYTVWQRFGDLAPADRNFAAMARWVDYLRSTAGADLIRNQDTYGDWLNVDDGTGNDLTSTAFFGWSARLVSRMAAATGRTAQAATYGTLADQIAAAFTGRFVHADNTVGTGSETGYVLALAFGLVPGDRVQAVADRLAAKVASRNGHLSVGFMGVENLLPVLADHGHADVAYRILQQPDYPGWGYMIARGATTIWERWDGIRPDGSLQDPGMNSFNHYGLGSVGDWLYREVGGVAPAAPGYAQVLLAPKPGGSLTSASAELTTTFGRVRSAWSRSGSAVTLQVVVATGTTATVRVPGTAVTSAPAEAVPVGGTSYVVGAGSYTFTSTL
ncbi:rhamnosidase [Actinoplanes sp. SE50]|uniref:family 78 glycoside hydrolase catalytic domain n=1 Tax=unclassified Actinoplanes TaxID=2626549 RepID=UPI00023EC5D1|nr:MULTISPECIES: family 78 glycoside hydrolase catalytic domain [unclassified Actinoplanes]AEV83627.1 alpha-L-rhamnosidase [Actinoplanes sp. SE50/110]ATO82229.1 rhamnosidase [Actinoplanes sp. SE50]SLL99636.1 rhamnosidase [Actinoplanes sp. SE50/110]